MDQIVVFVFAAIVVAMFSVNLAYSVRAYTRRRAPRDRRRPRRAARFRGVIKSFVIEVGVLSIFVARIIAIANADADTRRYFGLIDAAAVSGALLVGGAFLVVSWIVDDGDDEGIV